MQISANISPETRALMDAYTSKTGLKKGYLIEDAIRHHLAALDELPPDILIPPRIVVDRKTGQQILDLVENPPPPTAALKALLAEE